MSVLFSLSVPSSLSSRSSRRRVTSGLLPPFLRLVIPNPQPAPAKASTLVELMYAHGKRWELKKERAGEVDTHGAHSIHASGVGAHLRRHLAVQDKGRAVLAALQQELYEQGEQGCQVRRESQNKYSLCCEGVTVLLNESHHDVTIDVPLPLQDGDAEAYARTDVTLRRLDTAVQAALRNHAS